MKKLGRIVALAAGLLASVLLALVLWLGWTTDGARWLLDRAGRKLPGSFEVGSLEGRLAGRLQLTDARWRNPQAEVEVKRLELAWHPVALLHGELRLERLGVVGLQVTTKAADRLAEPVESEAWPEWPRLQGWLLTLRARVQRLDIEQACYCPESGDPVEVRRLTGELLWRGGRLTWRKLDLEGFQGRLTGRLSFGFAQRTARAELEFVPNDPKGRGVRQLSLDTELAVAEKDAWARGRLVMRLERPSGRVAELATDLLLDHRALTFASLHLARPGVSGTATGRARLFWGKRVKPVVVDLQLEDADFGEELGFPGRVSGTVTGELGPSGYQGRFDLTSAGERWWDMALAGTVTGNWRKLELGALEGRWLQGTVTGRADLGWSGVPKLAAELRGRGLDSSVLAANWDGDLDLEVAGDLTFPDEGLQAQWQARLHPSRFLGHPVRGSLDGAYREGDLRVDSLHLRGRSLVLDAGGRLGAGLQVELAVADLDELLPGATGTATAKGTIRWSAATGWEGEGRVRGAQLAWNQWRAQALNAGVRWDGGEGTGRLDAELDGVGKGAWEVEGLTLEVAGDVEDHRLDLSGHWPDGRLAARLTGGWTGKEWRGQLSSLSALDERIGRWRLARPVVLRASRERLRWERAELLGARHERLDTAGDLTLQPLDGKIEGKWQDFDLAWVGVLMADAEIAGNSSGELQLEWRDGRLATLDARTEGRGRWRQGERMLEVSRAELDAHWGADGLEGTWRVAVAERGALEGEVFSRQQARLALPERGRLLARWNEFDLALANPWLTGVSLTGTSSGEGLARWDESDRLTIHLEARARPTIGYRDRLVTIDEARLSLDWNDGGLKGDLVLAKEQPQGRLEAKVRSSRHARLGWPETGRLELRATQLDLDLFQGWMPRELGLEGRLDGTAEGGWQGRRLDLGGRLDLEQGRFVWSSGEREVVSLVRTAALDWSWKEARLAAELAVELQERGRLQGDLVLPLPAEWPPALRKDEALSGTLKGEFREEGLLSNFFPGLVQESRGILGLDVNLDGTWQQPGVHGTASLNEAGGYLPAAGIRLRDVGVRTRFGGNRIVIDALQARSGSGQIVGEGEIGLSGLTPQQVRLTIRGEDFRIMDLPELEVGVSPDLVLHGQGGQWKVTGKLLVPEALILGPQGQAPVGPSPDLVVLDAPPESESERKYILAVDVQVMLGDHVLVKTRGIDARLTGSVEVSGEDLDDLTGQGRIEVAQGAYSAFGVRLEITRGALIFSDVPVDRPTLDILALRSVDEVRAGVRITGTPRKPVVKLYSEPAMPDTDVLAYIVLGHPLGGETGQANLLMSAAATLLSQGESAVLQDRIKRQLGIDVLDVQTGEGEMTESVVTIGKYLSPELYISYGQSLFSETSQVGLRYDLSNHWQVESTMGQESGVDLYYRITFD